MKVLLVDDSFEIVEMLSQFFTLKGDQVDTAHDGNEAVKKISDGNYDAIILDLAMPKASGFEALEKLKDTNKLEPEKIFVLTAMNITKSEQDRITKFGVKNTLLKPVNIHDLYDAVTSK
ncbi:MAG: response regulator [Nitrosopumilus sp.]|nr:MAG: response regulator [Nitrosopumilus sp.]